MDAKTLGEMIYRKRVSIIVGEGRSSRPMGLRELGKLLGISPSNISRYERGISAPSSHHVDKIYQWLGIISEKEKTVAAE